MEDRDWIIGDAGSGKRD